MGPGSYATGVFFFAVTAGASALAAEIVCRRRLSDLPAAPRLAAQAMLTASAVALSVLVPGAFGVLTRGSMAVTSALIAAGSSLVRPTGRPPTTPEAARPQSGRVGRVLAVASLLVAGTWIFGEFVHTVRTPLTAMDFTSYDLPVIGRWIQTGSLWRITELFPLQTHGTYPQNSHLVIASVVLAFHNDALVGFLEYPFLPLAAVAVYATVSELGAARSTSAVFAAMFTLIPMIALDVQAGPPDTIAIAAFAIGVLFLVRHARTGLTSDLVLAGVGLGFAAGSFWYYASAVAALVIVWAGWRAVIIHSRRNQAREVAVLIGMVAACSGFWLVRNWVGAGDPVYPVRVALGDVTVFAAPHDIYRALSGFSIADYLGKASVLRHYIGPALGRSLGVPGAIVLVGYLFAAAAAALPAGRRRHPNHTAWGLLLALAPVLAVVYVLTPYSAFGGINHPSLTWVNVRYGLPAVTIALALAAAVVGRAGRRARTLGELAALAAALQGAHEAYHLLGTPRSALAVGLVLSVASAAVGWAWYRADESRRRYVRGLRMRFALTTAAVAAVAMIGYATQRSLNSRRYAPYDATYAWIQRHPQPLKIGLSGSWNFSGASPAWAMFGARLQNQVSFVGFFHHDHLTQYPTAEAWLNALHRERYDLVEIARNAPNPATTDNELRWAEVDRLPLVTASPRFELVRVR